jgi:hypothetical protein
MSQTNYFHIVARCTSCQSEAPMSFESDIGVIEYHDFDIGDIVIKSTPLVPRRGKHPKPIGPALDVDWDRPFWAVGLARCPTCGHTVTARIEIRERRFFAVTPTLDEIDVFAWGYLVP